MKVKVIITTTLSLDEFFRVYLHKTTKEMWDIVQITHEETTEVKRKRFDTLIHEYELFKVKYKESINQMQALFTHIVSHMRTLGKHFQMRNLL